jgi:integrase
VEVRERSIRVAFTLEGVAQRHTLMLNGRPLPPTPANIKYAHRLALEIRERIRHGTFSLVEYFPASGAGAAPVTVGAQLDTWLAAQRIEASTRKGYESVLRFWKPLLGDKPLRSLKHSDVLTALASRPELSGKTINNRVSVLRKALALAVLDKLMPDNPSDSIASAKWQRQPVDPFTADEAARIVAAMSGQAANYIAAKFYTGLRTSESFGLKWGSVDLAAKQMVVSEARVGGVAKGTKTNTVRTVFLSDPAVEALKAQKAHTFLAGAHVFTDPRDGQPWTERKFRDFWVPTLKRLGIRHRRAYNTRHTYATMMLMAGMRPAFCAGQMGHSVEVFLRTYAKWIPGAGDAAEMAKLNSALSSPEVTQKGRVK